MTPAGASGEELFRQLYPGLRRFAGVIRPPGMEPDDLVQEAVARTLARRSLESLAEPGAYLRKAMVRVAMNATRGRARADVREARVAVPEGTSDTYPSDMVELMRVPVKARAVLYLTIIDGLGYREAGEMLGCSEAAARKLPSRATTELRRQLSKEALA